MPSPGRQASARFGPSFTHTFLSRPSRRRLANIGPHLRGVPRSRGVRRMSKQLCELSLLKHILKYRLPPSRPSPIRRMSGLPIRSNGTATTSSATASIPRRPIAPRPNSQRARALAASASSRAGRNVPLDLIPGLHRIRILIRRLDRGRLPPSRCETLAMRPQFRQSSSIERFLSARRPCRRLCLRLGHRGAADQVKHAH
jgi:hypothetical protein